ncbi:MAG: hypothetical protein RSB83_11590, partial [Brevundimonas sp.]
MSFALAAVAALLSHAPVDAVVDAEAPIQTAPVATAVVAAAPAVAPPPFKLINHDESYAYLADRAK